MTPAQTTPTAYEVRRGGWARESLLAALKALEPVKGDTDGDAVLAAELVAQMLDVLNASPSEDDGLVEALNCERIRGVSPRMLPIARAVLDEDIAQLTRIANDPVDVLIDLLEELRPDDRADEPLEELPAHLAALHALAALGTPRAFGFLLSWLPYTDLLSEGSSAGTDPSITRSWGAVACAALRAAGEAGHTAIINAWPTLPWFLRAHLLECVLTRDIARHETVLQSFAEDLHRIEPDQRVFFAYAAAGYSDPTLVPRVQALLDLCLDDIARDQSLRGNSGDFNDVSEIVDVLQIELKTVLSESQLAQYEAAQERFSAELQHQEINGFPGP